MPKTDVTVNMVEPGEEWRAQVRHEKYVVASTWRIVRGRPEPVEIAMSHVDGVAVAANRVRQLPIGELMDRCRAAVTRNAEVYAAAVGQIEGRPAKARRVREHWVEYGPQRGKQTPAEELQEVAAVYRQAWEAGKPVTQAVRDRFKLSTSGAGKRIMAARKAGLLEGIGRTA